MKRNPELIRAILLQVEADAGVSIDLVTLNIEGFEDRLVSYHVNLLRDAGFLEAEHIPDSSDDGWIWMPKRLTWNGHEFLDAVRSNQVWSHTKSTVERIEGFTLGIMKEIAVAYIKQRIGLVA
jgi:hypothetical protein